LITAATLAATALVSPQPAQAYERWPDIPPEIGARQLRPVGLFPYRCADGLVYNFYDGAVYSEPPAIYLGQTYRPYYRYTAAKVIPRTYFVRRGRAVEEAAYRSLAWSRSNL
jgi:hypothetical protein